MRIIFDAYNNASEGVKALKESLIAKGFKTLLIKTEGSRYKYKDRDVIINWGRSVKRDVFDEVPIINMPNVVAIASNKLNTFRSLPQDLIPPWTTDREVVKSWLEEGSSVCARKVLNGAAGVGLEIFDITMPFVNAPLYTKYIKKKHEYRIHVLNNKVIDIQRKAVRPGFQNPNFKIRNLENGFIFARNDLDVPAKVEQYALDSVRILGLDFGAVDIIWNEKNQLPYVLEINTAPGLTGTTVDTYANNIIESFT